MPFFAGKSASLLIDGAVKKFRNWSLVMEATRIDVTNFTSVTVTGAFREYLSGFFSGTFTADGPHDPTLSVPAQGDEVGFVAVIGLTYQYTGSMVITKIGIKTNIEGAGELSIEGAVTGPVDLDLSS